MNEQSYSHWDSEEFEDVVASTLISFYESKLKKNSGVPPHDNLKDKHLSLFHRIGPYIAGPSAEIIAGPEGEHGEYDLRNDPLPKEGCFTFLPKTAKESDYDGYVMHYLVRHATSLGKQWHRQDSGQLYEMLIMSPTSRGQIEGERRFFTVNEHGTMSCISKLTNHGRFLGMKHNIVTTESHILEETTQWASVTLQSLALRRFSWVISAYEKEAKAHIGCTEREIKSLLYARDLPQTKTGRKRPILHLVNAHHRRMKNGTDVDVRSHLRGTQEVIIGDTKFVVRPPKVMANDMPTSQRYFEGDE